MALVRRRLGAAAKANTSAELRIYYPGSVRSNHFPLHRARAAWLRLSVRAGAPGSLVAIHGSAGVGECFVNVMETVSDTPTRRDTCSDQQSPCVLSNNQTSITAIRHCVPWSASFSQPQVLHCSSCRPLRKSCLASQVTVALCPVILVQRSHGW